MKTWQIRLEKMLAESDAPPVLTRDLLSRFARTAREGAAVPPSTLSHWLRHAARVDRLRPVQRGLYLNRFRSIPGAAADATPWLQADAVVSLNTVLGDAGVLNNPVRIVTAVVPLDTDAPPPTLGRRMTQAGTFHFFGLPRRILQAGSADDRLEPTARFEHPRATPEKALIDWLYLGHSPRSRRTPPPAYDLDTSLLNTGRLKRLAQVTHLGDQLRELLKKTEPA